MKEYAEIDSFVWREEENHSFQDNFGNLNNKMSPKSNSKFGNLTVTFSPDFVRNIECSANGGKLVSILPPKNDFECYVVRRNDKYVKSISYPRNVAPNFVKTPIIKVTEITDDNNNNDVAGQTKIDKNTQTAGNGKVPEKPERNVNPSSSSPTRYEKKPQPSRTEVPEKLTHAESKDSLVTQSLLNLTSYDAHHDDQVTLWIGASIFA
jgi:hypothetical protein